MPSDASSSPSPQHPTETEKKPDGGRRYERADATSSEIRQASPRKVVEAHAYGGSATGASPEASRRRVTRRGVSEQESPSATAALSRSTSSPRGLPRLRRSSTSGRRDETATATFRISDAHRQTRFARVDQIILQEREREGRHRLLTTEEDIFVDHLIPYYQLLRTQLHTDQRSQSWGRSCSASFASAGFRPASAPQWGVCATHSRSFRSSLPSPVKRGNGEEEEVDVVGTPSQTRNSAHASFVSSTSPNASFAQLHVPTSLAPSPSCPKASATIASALSLQSQPVGETEDGGTLWAAKSPHTSFSSTCGQCTPDHLHWTPDSAAAASPEPRKPTGPVALHASNAFARVSEVMWRQAYHPEDDEAPPASARTEAPCETIQQSLTFGSKMSKRSASSSPHTEAARDNVNSDKLMTSSDEKEILNSVCRRNSYVSSSESFHSCLSVPSRTSRKSPHDSSTQSVSKPPYNHLRSDDLAQLTREPSPDSIEAPEANRQTAPLQRREVTMDGRSRSASEIRKGAPDAQRPIHAVLYPAEPNLSISGSKGDAVRAVPSERYTYLAETKGEELAGILSSAFAEETLAVPLEAGRGGEKDCVIPDEHDVASARSQTSRARPSASVFVSHPVVEKQLRMMPTPVVPRDIAGVDKTMPSALAPLSSSLYSMQQLARPARSGSAKGDVAEERGKLVNQPSLSIDRPLSSSSSFDTAVVPPRSPSRRRTQLLSLTATPKSTERLSATPTRASSFARSAYPLPGWVGTFAALQAEECVTRASLCANEYYEWSNWLRPMFPSEEESQIHTHDGEESKWENNTCSL